MSAPEFGRVGNERDAAQAYLPGTSAEAPSFGGLLESVRHHVDRELGIWLAPRLLTANAVSAEVFAAAQAVERLALRGGKRLRAALIVAAFEACSPDRERLPALLRAVDRAAVAIELLQVYLLIHDDWMDDDDVRRGGPAVHVALRDHLGSKRLGDTAAILAGDLACAYAQEALLEVPLPPPRVLAAARAFARIQADVVQGQLAEISPMLGARSGGALPSVELIHALKTASYTVSGPLAMGAHLAGASDARVAQLVAYGRPLGIAFQLRDDLLGIFGEADATGKPVGNDIRQGKHTALVEEMQRDERGRAALVDVLGREDASAAAVAEVVRVMEACGAKERVEARLGKLLTESRAALAAMVLPAGSLGLPWLSGAIDALGERSS